MSQEAHAGRPAIFLQRGTDDYKWRILAETDIELLRVVAANLLHDFQEALDILDDLTREEPEQVTIPANWRLINGGEA